MYTFLDASGATQSADSSVVSDDTQRPIVDIGNILTSIITISGVTNQSVSGTIGASIVGQLPGGTAILGSIAALQSTNPWNIAGSVAAFQAGTRITSISGVAVSQIAPTASFISGVTSIMNQTTPTSVLVAAGTNIKNYVTHIIATNSAANGTFVDIKDGGGNVMYSGYAAASGGGFSSSINPPLIGSANKSVDAAPRTQASVIVAMTGYTA